MEKLTTKAVENVFDSCAIQSQEMFDKTPDAIITFSGLAKAGSLTTKV